MQRTGSVVVALAGTLLAGCLVQPPHGEDRLEPGWKQSEMLVMSFNLKGTKVPAALDGLAETVREVKPRYVALQDLTKEQAELLGRSLGMRVDYCASGKDADGPTGVAVLSKGEPVMRVFTSQTAVRQPWFVKNPPKHYPRAAISVQFGEHEIASAMLAEGPGKDEERIGGLMLYKEVCNQHRPAVMSIDMGEEKREDALWKRQGELFRLVSPEDDRSGNCIMTRWNFASQFGLDWNRMVPVKGFGGRKAVLANIKY